MRGEKDLKNSTILSFAHDSFSDATRQLTRLTNPNQSRQHFSISFSLEVYYTVTHILIFDISVRSSLTHLTS